MSLRGWMEDCLEDRLFRQGGCITRPTSAPPSAFCAPRSARSQIALNHVGGMKTASEKKLYFLSKGKKKRLIKAAGFSLGVEEWWRHGVKWSRHIHDHRSDGAADVFWIIYGRNVFLLLTLLHDAFRRISISGLYLFSQKCIFLRVLEISEEVPMHN